MKQITLLFLMITFCFSAITVKAAVPVATPFATTSITEKKADMPAWKMKIVEKFQQKIAKKFAKPIDMSDPVKKWLWYAIFSWLGGLICYIVAVASAVGTVTTGSSAGLGVAGIFGILGWILFLAALVFFIVWLVKRFG